MIDSPFNDFVNTLDFAGISGPTPVEEAHDALEQRDLAIRLTALFNAGVLRGLDGSSGTERSAWRNGADFAVASLPQAGKPCYELTRLQLYSVLVKAICRAYCCVDVSVVNAAASAVLSVFAREVDAALKGAWQRNVQSVVLDGDTVVRLAMQASYVYSDLHPAATLH